MSTPMDIPKMNGRGRGFMEEIDSTSLNVHRNSDWYNRKSISLAFLALATAYFIATLLITPESPYGRIAVYIFIFLKVVFEFVPIELVTRPFEEVWERIEDALSRIPGLIKGAIGGFVIISLALMVTYGYIESDLGTRVQRSQSLLGSIILLTLMCATSRDFKRINWHTAGTGIFLQLLVGIFVLKTTVGAEMFTFLSHGTSQLLSFADKGTRFVIGDDLVKTNEFVFLVLPTILFFASVVQILYYLGVMQWIITKSARFFKVIMNTTVCESVPAAASPFVGMGEAALLVKPFLADMTRSELHQVMTSGFATISGSVLIAFIRMKVDPKSLITSCVMSVPCSLALSKIRYPESEESRTKGIVETDSIERESNILHAAANGAAQGITLCLLIGATLLAIISLLALTDAVLIILGSYLKFDNLTLTKIGSYLFWPLAWLVGVPSQDCFKVGSLLAIKLFSNEFIAYAKLSELAQVSKDATDRLQERSIILATYALCGFANFASIGIQVGCLGAMAPSRKRDLAELAMSSMFTGTISTFISAALAGLLI